MDCVSQKKVMALISEGVITQKAICQRLKISQPAVSKLMKKLREKGEISGLNWGVISGGGIPGGHPPLEKFRYHGIRTNCRILNSSSRYKALTAHGQRVLTLDGRKVVLNRHSLQLFDDPLNSIWGATPEAAEENSIREVFRLIGILEYRFNVMILKELNTGVSIFGHRAWVAEPMGAALHQLGRPLIIKDDTGKERMRADKSLGPSETEFNNALTGREDMGRYRAGVLDWLNDEKTRPGYLLEGLKAVMGATEDIAKEIGRLKGSLELSSGSTGQEAVVGPRPDYFG